MKPTHSILSTSFRYVPATATSVHDTWSRFGWRPTSQERWQRAAAAAQPVADAAAVPGAELAAPRSAASVIAHSDDLVG